MKKYKKYLEIVNNEITKFVEKEFTFNEKLKEMVKHSLNGGKRLRSIIPIIIGLKLNPNIILINLSLGIELLHNSSLIIDDMPCMDNDKFRRGLKTIHYKYGETNAQLLVGLLLENAYRLLNKNITEIKNKKLLKEDYLDKISILIFKNINDNMGLLGAATGQFIDTCPINNFLSKEEYTEEYQNLDKLLDLVHLKTTTFFEISFLSSYLLSGGNLNNIDKLKKAVKFFGLAFQISDDFEDINQDIERIKESKFNPNLVCKYGKEKILNIYEKSKKKFLDIMIELNINDELFNEILFFLDKRVNKNI